MTASLRQNPADFYVAEELGFEPSADGEHDFLHIEKTGLTTDRVASALAKHAEVHVRNVGFSGMKDRHAVTRQWLSVQRSPGKAPDWDSLHLDGLRLLAVTRHSRKLKRGSHKRNRFRLVLRDCDGSPGLIAERLERLAETGMPNYFGEQRFGRRAGNLALAESFFGGRRLSRLQRSMALSSARAFVFNQVLAARVDDDSWRFLQDGDVAGLDGTGSVFAVERLDDVLQSRAAAQDLHPTGPLWGAGTQKTGLMVAQREQEIAVASGFSAGLEKNTKGARRALRCRIGKPSWEFSDATFTLEFTLMRGSFATALIRELVRYSD